MLVGVVRRFEAQVLPRQRPIVLSQPLHAIDDRGVTLQAHALAQAIDEYAGDARPLTGQASLLLDDGCHYQRLIHGCKWQVGLAGIPRILQRRAQWSNHAQSDSRSPRRVELRVCYR